MLNFIGSGSAFNTRLGNNSAYRKVGDRLFLIDCGSSVFERLVNQEVLTDVKQITVIITHLHPDHVGSLGDLIFYSLYKISPLYQVKTTMLIPAGIANDLKEVLRLMGIADSLYELIVFAKTYELEGMGITDIQPIAVEHIKGMPAYGYLLRINGKKVYYSGDSNEIPTFIVERLLRGEIDFFYQDTCKAEFNGNPHLSLRKLTEIIPSAHRDRVYCMHLDEEFSIEEAEALGFRHVF